MTKPARIDIPADTRVKQLRASDPTQSAWVSANAGSGKTYVLASRVVRLLLAGVDPATILCLTYTKAAAANMANNVFKRLADWSGLDDEALAKDIVALTGNAPTATDLSRARRLFARAVETPGGLKIQTIHGFCELVLHNFPFEANVPGAFRVADETEEEILRAAAIEKVVARTGSDAELAAALSRVVEESSDQTFRAMMKKVTSDYRSFFHGGPSAIKARDDALRAIAASHGVAAGDDPAQIALAYHAAARARLDFAHAQAVLSAGAPSDRNTASRIASLLSATNAHALMRAYARLFLNKDGVPRTKFMTKTIAEANSDLANAFESESEEFLRAHKCYLGALLLDRTRAFYAVATAVASEFARTKSQRNILDFRDLIDKTEALLSRYSAAWVHYKLDRGISHLLIDEAQDTSPAQWRIVDALVAEFTAGEGAQPMNRTLFVVGDEKQSIYGFMGAAPKGFAEWGRGFRRRYGQIGRNFAEERLTLSFRSSREVLAAVDSVFSSPPALNGLVFDETDVAPTHESLHRDRLGFVELWPIVPKQESKPIRDAFADPAAVEEKASPATVLAEQITNYLGQLFLHGDPTGRPVYPGDIMVLVRRRGPLFEAIIRALKQAGLPVAGADRLVLGEHIAVMDLLALARVMVLEDDDFSLACVLKSPLFGLDDADLLRFAPARQGSLWQALRVAAETEPALHEALVKIERCRRHARAGPFGFFAHVLEEEGGRRALISRLGPDAADAIDAFLSRALAHERSGMPTLVDFLENFATSSGEIKRDMDLAGGEIRVMTVHGAKGLEAPIVILPDTTTLPSDRNESRLVDMPIGEQVSAPVWVPSAADETECVAKAKFEERKRESEEYQRLLYVALTRAENGLVICGHVSGNRKGDRLFAEGSWYDLVEQGLRNPRSDFSWFKAEEVMTEAGPIIRWRRTGAGTAQYDRPTAPKAGLEEAAPEWLFAQAPLERPSVAPLAPSHASAADRPDRPEVAGSHAGSVITRRGGIFAHRLMEVLANLPADRHKDVGLSLAKRYAAGLSPDQCEEIIKSIGETLRTPGLAALFGPSSQAEVPIAGDVQLGGKRQVRVSGRIDRLAVTADTVFIADFKFGAAPASKDAVPLAHISQVAVYHALVSEIYPRHACRALIIYPGGPAAFELPLERLRAACAAITPP